jgi:hypothetical protein
MIAPVSYQPRTQIKQMKVASLSNSGSNPNGLSRVFAAAVVSRQFCQMLLQDPHTALQRGYLGETFKLSEYERDLLVSIRAESLSDLARQLVDYGV